MTVFTKDFLEQLRKPQKKTLLPSLDSERKVEPAWLGVLTKSPAPPPETGQYVIHDKEGHLIKIAHYEDGKLNGLFQIFDPETKHLIQESHFICNLLSGFQRTYDSAGRILMQSSFMDGQKEGCETVYSKGLKTSETFYVGGKKEGRYLRFGPAGNTLCEGSYVNDLLEGPYSIFDPDKKILRKCFYEKGQLHGPCTFYSPSGNPLQETLYEHGVPRLLTKYFPNGHISSLSIYNPQGVRAEEKKFALTGELVETKAYAPVESAPSEL